MRNWFSRTARKQPRRPVRYRPTVEGLEQRELLAAPVIDPITDVTPNVPDGKTLFLPVRGSDADGDPITYTASSNNADIAASVRQGQTLTYLRLSVQGFGDLVFQLYNDLAPQTVQTITNLVNSGFYNGLTFHRIVRDFVIQGGDPAGDGSGGPGFDFDDEFNPNVIFSGNGQLAMANSGKDTNGSQFFITIGPERNLDFNHTIWGQLVRGFDVLNALNQVPTTGDRPNTPPVISSATIIQNTTDAVIVLRAREGVTSSATITVTATDPNNESSNRTFTATAVNDATNDPPILNLPVPNVTTQVNTPVTVTGTATDIDTGGLEFRVFGPKPAPGAVDTGALPPGITSTSINGNQVTITPAFGFVGTVTLRLGVKQAGATSRGSTTGTSATDPRIFDTQEFTLTVLPAPPDIRPINQRFVSSIFRDFLGREAAPSEVAQLAPALDRVSRPAFIGFVMASPEFLRHQVEDTYQTFLGRAPDPQGLRRAVEFLGNGGDLNLFRSIVLSSPEYFSNAGGSTNGFLSQFFSDVEGRNLSAAEQSQFAGLLDGSVANRQAFIMGRLDSVQRNVFFAQTVYNEFLGRGASRQDVLLVSNALTEGFVPDEAFLVAVASSDEYFAKV